MLNWKAREIDERGEQLLLLLTADDAQCFHSEDEDIPQVPMALTSSDVTAAAAAAAPASESTNAFQAARPSASCATANLCSSSGRGKGRSRNIRTRPHVFRSQLANRLIHLLKPFSSHAAVGAHSDADAEGVLEGPHQVSAKLAQRVLQRVDLQPLVRVDILQTIAMVQQTSARRHLKFSQRTAGCASSDPLAEQTNAQQLPLQLSSHSEVCTHAAPVHSTSISPCPSTCTLPHVLSETDDVSAYVACARVQGAGQRPAAAARSNAGRIAGAAAAHLQHIVQNSVKVEEAHASQAQLQQLQMQPFMGQRVSELELESPPQVGAHAVKRAFNSCADKASAIALVWNVHVLRLTVFCALVSALIHTAAAAAAARQLGCMDSTKPLQRSANVASAAAASAASAASSSAARSLFPRASACCWLHLRRWRIRSRVHGHFGRRWG